MTTVLDELEADFVIPTPVYTWAPDPLAVPIVADEVAALADAREAERVAIDAARRAADEYKTMKLDTETPAAELAPALAAKEQEVRITARGARDAHLVAHRSRQRLQAATVAAMSSQDAADTVTAELRDFAYQRRVGVLLDEILAGCVEEGRRRRSVRRAIAAQQAAKGNTPAIHPGAFEDDGMSVTNAVSVAIATLRTAIGRFPYAGIVANAIAGTAEYRNMEDLALSPEDLLEHDREDVYNALPARVQKEWLGRAALPDSPRPTLV